MSTPVPPPVRSTFRETRVQCPSRFSWRWAVFAAGGRTVVMAERARPCPRQLEKLYYTARRCPPPHLPNGLDPF